MVTSRLARRLGTVDAVAIGLASMIGAGIFTAVGSAAAAAGSGLLLGLVAAGFVAYCNATSSAALAARHPESGGTYVYGREQLGHLWGFVAGWGFLAAKTASAAAIALTFGSYVGSSDLERPLAAASVVVLTFVNCSGVRKTAWITRVSVVLVLATLAVVVAGSLFGGHADIDRVGSLTGSGLDGILRSAGILFFAFAGYARIATLGEEVREPAVTIPRAIPIALGITLATYALVSFSALVAVGPHRLATADAPLLAPLRAGSLDGLTPVVRVGAAVATLGVLISLLAGISRTTFAMASRRDLPPWLDAVHPRFRVPHRAELTVGVVVTVLVCVVDLRGAIGFSAFTVLVYYAITNIAAWTLPPEHRRWPRALQVLGMIGCATLAFSLPIESVIAGSAVVLTALPVRWIITRLVS